MWSLYANSVTDIRICHPKYASLETWIILTEKTLRTRGYNESSKNRTTPFFLKRKFPFVEMSPSPVPGRGGLNFYQWKRH